MRFAAVMVIFIVLLSGAYAEEGPGAISSWEHNGSTVGMKRNRNHLVLFYLEPGKEMRDTGVTPGTQLFEGTIVGRSEERVEIIGKAYVFSSLCGPIPYKVEGFAVNDRGKAVITLRGEAPLLHEGCEYTFSWDTPNAQLNFYLIRKGD